MPKKLYTCKTCGKRVSTLGLMRRHYAQAHPKNGGPPRAKFTDATPTEAQVGYVFGHIESEVLSFARRVGVSPRVLTERLARLLGDPTSRERLGADDQMSTL